MNEGERQLGEALHHSEELANSTQQRSSLERVQGMEQAWGSDFANPLVEKRRAVDSGNATVAELQIFYLQKDPNSWVARSSEVLDDVDRENRLLLETRRHSDELAATSTILAAVLSCLFAVGLGIVIAYRTATGITGPLNRLIHVADQIGQTGDLEHTIDVHGKDEIGQLARTFDSMVKYLKEMAAVSEAIAGVIWRSKCDRGRRTIRWRTPSRACWKACADWCGTCATPPHKWPAPRRRWPALRTNRPATVCRLRRPSMKSRARCTK